jgi:hypothetical protein
MSDISTLNPAPMTDSDYEAEIDRMILEMKKMVADMAEREKQIEKRFVETNAILSSMKAH